VIFFSTIARDISERKRAEAELQRTNEELEQRVERRTQELAQSNIALQGEIVERHLAMGALKEVVTQLEVSKAQAEQANTELRANELHLIEGNRIFTELARLHASTQGELENVLSSITQASSEMLGVERCSVWRAEESQGEESIVCLDLYERSSGRHSRGARLLKRNYPAYFQALEAGVILAEDAHSHPATSEFSAGYLAPVGIGAMMDIAVANNGRLTGVVCYEHVGGPRQWKIEDQTFAASAAAIYTLAIEARERARTGEALRLAKEEAEQARQEAERANAAKSEFLSRMSHELRTPLNAILGFGQILELGELPPKKREGVGHILKAGEHLLNLINEVLDISRIEAGKMALSLEPVSLPATVHAVFDLARPLASAGNVQLIDEVQQHPWHLMADSQKLRQALLNLISNAIKYNSSGGSVSVSAQAVGEGQRLRISVRDTGLGLRAQDVTKLFTPFERLGAAQTRIEGTGIGLALTKRLVEIMGGDVGAASTWGDGSTFWIELPLVTSPLQAAQGQIEQEHAHPVARLPGKPKTILYIEDNLANLQLVAALLESVPGVRLLTATQGSTGLDMAFEHGPDLIILDLHLPDINGDRVLERLQSNALTGHIPVIMLSADATQGQIERLLAAGARTYITKPLNVKQFLRSVEENLHEL
jgi:signal transduction histidine kinase/ActR/RegA family two-component response regulator